MGSEIRPFRRQRSDIGIIRSDTNIFVSTTGNDNNSGLTESKPFRTIAKAFDYLKGYHILDGATVTVTLAAGKYRITEQVVMDHPQGSQITLKGYNGTNGNVESIGSYEDTSTYSGRVAGKTYIKIQRTLNDTPVNNLTGERYDMQIRYDASGSGIPQSSTATGNYIVVSPLDSSQEIQFNYNEDSLVNGNYSNNTDIQRYSESESTMRRFFAFGGHRIRTNLADFGSYPIVDNRTRNNNVYSGIANTVTSRVSTLSSPVGVSLYNSDNTSVDARYISTVIQVVGDTNALCIKNSGLCIQDLAFEARDPVTSSAGPVTSSGIVVDDGSILTLKHGIVVKGFDIGINVKNKSLLNQADTTVNPYTAITYCKTGLLVTDGSTAVLNGVIANGCWNDGFVVNSQSVGEFNSCIAVGNGRHGFVALRNSNAVCVRCASAYNMQNVAKNFNVYIEGGIGFGSRLNSNLESSGCMSFRNGYGFFADKNSYVHTASSDVADNINRGISVTETSSAVFGPYVYSKADAHGLYVSDTSFARVHHATFDLSGFETASGEVGSGVVAIANSNVNLFDVNVTNYAFDGINATYGSFVTSDGLNITENASTSGDSVKSTYGSVARLSGADLGNKNAFRYSLLNGYIEQNGVEVDGTG